MKSQGSLYITEDVFLAIQALHLKNLCSCALCFLYNQRHNWRMNRYWHLLTNEHMSQRDVLQGTEVQKYSRTVNKRKFCPQRIRKLKFTKRGIHKCHFMIYSLWNFLILLIHNNNKNRLGVLTLMNHYQWKPQC